MSRVCFGFVLVALLLCTSSVSALKILGISTVASPSHHIWFTALMNGLARKGHEIYALGVQMTKFDAKEVMENQTTSIVFQGVTESILDNEATDQILSWTQMNPTEMSWLVYQFSTDYSKVQIETEAAKRVLELVKNTEFDVIVQDVVCGQCFYALVEVAKGNPSFVAFSPYGSPNWIKDIVGGNDWPAIKHFPPYPHTFPYSLWEKTVNFIYHEIDNIIRQYYYLPREQELAEKFIGKKLSRSLGEIEKTISLLMVNTYAAFEPAAYLPPNVIEVGGLHVKDPKPLPQDIKAFLDGAEHGVVVISLGTNVKTSILGLEKVKAILTALGKLKQRVLWKFDADNLAGQPKNVMIKRWLPQSDVLAHPKVRVLWSHCGLLSTQEAIWRGVPMIGMPFLFDQNPNIDILVKKGVALRLDFASLTTEKISETLDRILIDPSFTSKMKRLSLEYRDRPMSPLDLAVWHVEHAARHPHAPLASPGRNLSRAQLNLLDVYAVLGMAVLLIFWIFWLLLRTVLNLIYPLSLKTKTA